MASRKIGKTSLNCTLCKSYNRKVRKYGINLCGRCFREEAPRIGFKKFN
ncbi:TPA: 30S ribosomal protein S14 [archaeon]|nr:30S ribosomal protein S14 [Euryarchaeota archaeon]HIK01397.1 30S ribosomal protein S14 [Candidatus Undinarchaeales archaeon ERR594346 U_76725]HIK02163.1 30S ribosomal protein S14 [Candidatus Undinarchaeales archaeon SRR5007147.bin71]